MFGRAFLLFAALILFAFNPLFAQDPGQRDTVIVSGGPLRVGLSLPIFVSIVNDEDISGFTTGFVYQPLDSGMARYDSVVWVNRMADPTVIAFRGINTHSIDGISPDSVMIGGVQTGANSNALPMGSGVIAEVYFTGESEGMMTFDSVFVLPNNDFLLVGRNPDNSQVVINPEFRTKSFLVLPNVIPPSQILSSAVTQATALSAIGLQIEPVSEFPGSMVHQLLSFRGFDDSALAPSIAPSFAAGDPSTFSWTPMMSDIGIWSATFSLCDSTGFCDTVSAEIQVVASEAQVIQLAVEEIPDAINFTGLLHGNFDSDPEPEIVVTGDALRSASVIRLYDNIGDGSFVQSYDFRAPEANINPQVGYVNSDGNLDVVMVGHRTGTTAFVVKILLGDGSNALNLLDQLESSGRVRGSALAEFTGDQFQDFITVGGGRFVTQVNKVRLFRGNAQSLFEFVSEFSVSDTAYTVSSADFNGDGYVDIAVGQFDGLSIHLNDGTGAFTQSAFYPFEFGVTGIDVTNQGADFNRDNNFDLCVTAPSVGGAESEIVVFLGQGDGTFNRQLVRRVLGQVLGNVVGDFNSDGDLDIAYINAALKHVGILFGDGSGAFPNELRFSVPKFIPRVMDATDVDLDGDMDILVGSSILSQNSGFSIFVYKNQSNPGGLSSASFLDITGLNNAQLELRSPSGRWLNSFGGTMASGEYYQRNIDGDNLIDDFSRLASVETGKHALVVTPKPNLPAGEPFSLEYSVNGKLFRLVDQAPMPMAGYEFALYPAGISPVQPPSGSFSYNAQPTLDWPGTGAFDFEFASDIGFSNVLHNAQVSEKPYSLPFELSEPDTTLYYWRVKPVGQPEYDAFFALNIIDAEITCGDADGSGKTNIADITFLIARIFAGGPAPDPDWQGDANGSGKTNIADITYLISFIFAGGLPPVCP